MPGPPPPPPLAPPPPMMGAPAVFNPPKSSTDDRAALLKSIQRGAKLKKTVTVDKSAPMIGKVASSNPAPAVNNGGGGYGGSPMPNGMGLGGLFAGGMPKLKPTKNKLGITPSKNTNSNPTEQNDNVKIQRERSPVQPAPTFNFASIQNEVKKKLANDNRDRGPPPPTPSADNVTAELNHLSLQQSNSGSSLVHSTAQANHSSLHRKTQSNVNISSLDNVLGPPSPGSTLSSSTRSINHGKPNLAPKPPVLNGKPKATPPKRLVTNGKLVSRAQSMKSPRSPPVQALDLPADSAIKYGTVRNMSSVLSHSMGNNLNSRSKMTLNGRPSAPPPSIPGTPPHQSQQGVSAPAPPSKTAMMKPPNHAPPPPPGVLPQPPNHAPPPPPHKTLPAKPTGLSFSSSQTPPPPPPPRNSSMRDQNQAYKKQSSILDFDERFKEMFRSPASFPKPPPFRNVLKIYSNRQGLKLIWNERNKRKGCEPKRWVRHYHFTYNGEFRPPNCVF